MQTHAPERSTNARSTKIVTEKDSPLERFREFVSEILSVTKEDIQKADIEAKEAVKKLAPEPEEEGEECP
jgi:hypothetical protein